VGDFLVKDKTKSGEILSKLELSVQLQHGPLRLQRGDRNFFTNVPSRTTVGLRTTFKIEMVVVQWHFPKYIPLRYHWHTDVDVLLSVTRV
jgi:hypothetical protein